MFLKILHWIHLSVTQSAFTASEGPNITRCSSVSGPQDGGWAPTPCFYCWVGVNAIQHKQYISWMDTLEIVIPVFESKNVMSEWCFNYLVFTYLNVFKLSSVYLTAARDEQNHHDIRNGQETRPSWTILKPPYWYSYIVKEQTPRYSRNDSKTWTKSITGWKLRGFFKLVSSGLFGKQV